MNPKLITIVLVLCSTLSAQAPANRVLGVASSLSSDTKQLSVKNDAGVIFGAKLLDNGQVLRIDPGETDLTKAAKIEFADIKEGDRVLVRGEVDAANKTVLARSIIVMSKDAVSARQAKEQTDWHTRSTTGIVKAVNASGKEIVLTARAAPAAPAAPAATPAPPATKEWTITVPAQTSIKRYADNSIKFADAESSTLDSVKPGDQLRVLGNKEDASSKIQAEAIVYGSFRTIAGEIKSVKPDTTELTITDLQTKKPLTIKISPDSAIRRMPSFGGGARGGGGGGGRPAGGPAGGPPGGPGGGPMNGPPGGMPQGGQRPGGGFGGGGTPDIQRMVERMPPVPFEELKPGDAVIVSAMRGQDGSSFRVITLVAGMDFLLRAPAQQVNQVVGNWSLDMGTP